MQQREQKADQRLIRIRSAEVAVASLVWGSPFHLFGGNTFSFRFHSSSRTISAVEIIPHELLIHSPYHTLLYHQFIAIRTAGYKDSLSITNRLPNFAYELARSTARAPSTIRISYCYNQQLPPHLAPPPRTLYKSKG